MLRLLLAALVSWLVLGLADGMADPGEDKAIALVQKFKGRVGRNKNLPGNPVVSVTLPHKQVTADDLRTVAAFKQLSMLFILESAVADDDLKELAPLQNLTTLALRPSDVTDATLATLQEVKLLHSLSLATKDGGKRPSKPDEVTVIDLSYTNVTDDGIKRLAVFKNVARVVLGSKITNKGLKELSVFQKLTALDLGDSNVTNSGVKEIAKLKNLSELRLSLSGVTTAGLKDIAPLKSLVTLSVPNHQLNDDALAVLRKMGKLHALDLATTAQGGRPTKPEDVASFNLSNAGVTEVGLREIVEFKNLTKLELATFKITDEVLATLRNNSMLHKLNLARGVYGRRAGKDEDIVSLDLKTSKISDAGLKALAGLKNLKELDLFATEVSAAGVKAFQKVLPNCVILHFGR